MRMTIKVLKEAGYEEALLGLSLSYRTELGKMPERAEKNAPLDGGHNKYLESIIIWVDVTAPRYWWQTADTYRLSTKQSESSTHTVLKRPLIQEDFVEDIDSEYLKLINTHIDIKDFRWVKLHLPEAFLQRRIWCMSYKTFRNIYYQRFNHKLPEWKVFLSGVLNGIEHPEYITTVGNVGVFDGVEIFQSQVIERERRETPGWPTEDMIKLSCSLIHEEYNELFAALDERNFPEMIDAIIDCMFVLLQLAYVSGVQMHPVWDEVMRANMAKKGGPVREDGKRLKPPGWTPPDVKGILCEQGWTGPCCRRDTNHDGNCDRHPKETK